jgi:hypothetical protein
MFTFINRRRGAIAALVLCIAALICTLPWGLYWLGLQGVDGKPPAPLTLITSDQQAALWRQAGCDGMPEMSRLDPVSYLLSAGSQDAPPSATLFAWRVASSYNRHHIAQQGVFWWQLSGSAMTIWLTRHWTIEQLLSKVAEIEAGKAGSELKNTPG